MTIPMIGASGFNGKRRGSLFATVEKKWEDDLALRREELQLRWEEMQLRKEELNFEKEKWALERDEREKRFQLENRERMAFISVLEKLLK